MLTFVFLFFFYLESLYLASSPSWSPLVCASPLVCEWITPNSFHSMSPSSSYSQYHSSTFLRPKIFVFSSPYLLMLLSPPLFFPPLKKVNLCNFESLCLASSPSWSPLVCASPLGCKWINPNSFHSMLPSRSYSLHHILIFHRSLNLCPPPSS